MGRLFLAIASVLVATAGLAGTQYVVGQKGRLYSPGKLTVKLGDIVVFDNNDNVTHHVYSSTKGQEFKLDTVAPGKKVSHPFAKRGRIDVRCGLHPGMRLVVTVQ